MLLQPTNTRTAFILLDPNVSDVSPQTKMTSSIRVSKFTVGGWGGGGCAVFKRTPEKSVEQMGRITLWHPSALLAVRPVYGGYACAQTIFSAQNWAFKRLKMELKYIAFLFSSWKMPFFALSPDEMWRLGLWDISLFCSFAVLFLLLVFTVYQSIISRKGKHLGDRVGLLLVAGVQQQKSLIAPLMLDPTEFGQVAETLTLITQLAGEEGGTWRPSGRRQCTLKTCISTVPIRILQLLSPCPCSTALNGGKAKRALNGLRSKVFRWEEADLVCARGHSSSETFYCENTTERPACIFVWTSDFAQKYISRRDEGEGPQRLQSSIHWHSCPLPTALLHPIKWNKTNAKQWFFFSYLCFVRPLLHKLPVLLIWPATYSALFSLLLKGFVVFPCGGL